MKGPGIVVFFLKEPGLAISRIRGLEQSFLEEGAQNNQFLNEGPCNIGLIDECSWNRRLLHENIHNKLVSR